jgi:hypothetical protein
MDRREAAAYEVSVIKTCRKWAANVTKELKNCKETIEKLNSALCKDISKIDAKSLDEGELRDAVSQISQILHDESDPVMELAIDVKADPKKKTVSLVIRYFESKTPIRA